MSDKEILEYALSIIIKRSRDMSRTLESRGAYNSAADILEYALEGNIECLREFDY